MHTTASQRLPAPARHFLSRLPARPGSWLFTLALNASLARHLDQDVRRALERKRLRLSVFDAGLSFEFTWAGDKRCFVPLPAAPEADLLIGATLHDLGLLAMRKEDPDTLFFSRRLVMEGDTELGLLIKNTLDAIDGALLDPQRLAPGALFNLLNRKEALHGQGPQYFSPRVFLLRLLQRGADGESYRARTGPP